MIVTINVTPEDILKGIRFSSSKCPITIALARMVNPSWFYSTGLGRCIMSSHPIVLFQFDDYYEAETSPGVKQFMMDFDRDGPSSVSPAAFVLNFSWKGNL